MAPGSIEDLVSELKSGATNPANVEPIRLFERDDKLFTLDNRRLKAFRQAGMKIPYRTATKDEIVSEAWKFSTENGGSSVRMRGKE